MVRQVPQMAKAKSFLPTSSLSLLALQTVKLIKTPAALRHSGRHIATLDSQSPICCPNCQLVTTVVDRVLQLVARAEFKRRQAPQD